MQNLIVINSLSHSGSTVLSMVMAGHRQLVSLGEIFQVLRDDPDKWLQNDKAMCSCGATARDCELWGSALKKISSTPALKSESRKYQNIADKYQIVLETFNELYGQNTTAIDTSKSFRHLKFISSEKQINAQIVFLIRDARAYATSQTRIARNQPRKGLRKIKRSASFQLIKWFFGNRQRQKYLNKRNSRYCQISYEDLCFHSEKTCKNICDYLNIDYQQAMLQLDQTKHHILFGNPMRLDRKKQLSLSYDSRWLANNDWAVPYALIPAIKSYNKKNTYPDL